MSFLTELFASGAGRLVKDVGDTVKKFVTTDADRLAFDLELKTKVMAFSDSMVTHADAYEGELTKRLEADMKSDSGLSKNIRPLALVFLLGVYTLLAVTDGNVVIHAFHFVIKDAYAAAFQSFTEYGLMFYFGGRSLEKVASLVSGAIKK